MAAERLDFQEVAAAALTRIDTLLALWLPDGQRRGHEWVACNPTRSDKKAGSFSVNLNSGAWADFATDDKGGDLVSLYCYLFRCANQAVAARELAEKFGCGEVPEKSPALQKKVVQEWQTVTPVPDFALGGMLAKHDFKQNSDPEMVSVYRNAVGQVLGAVCRFRKSDGGKDDLPRTFCRNTQTGVQMWRWKSWDSPRPLCGLDALAVKPDSRVLIVEGEKCKNAAVESGLFTDFAVVSWPGGTNGYVKCDWTPIAGREVVLWPDADAQRIKLTDEDNAAGKSVDDMPYLPAEQQPGIKVMRSIAEILIKQGCVCRMVSLPEPGELPGGYDIADALADGTLNPVEVVRYALPYKANIPPTPAISDPVDLADVNAALSEAAAENAGAADIEGCGDEVARGGILRKLLDNFAIIEGKTRAIDLTRGTEYGKQALFARFGRLPVDEWWEHERRQFRTPAEVSKIKRDCELSNAAQDSEVLDALRRYIYLDGSTNIWDMQLFRVIDQASCKLALGSKFSDWLDSPLRRVIPAENVRFEPGRDLGDGFINIFRGLPFKPEYALVKRDLPKDIDDLLEWYPACKNIVKLVYHLCNNDKSDVEWLLNWIAYPLQNLGAKMATAVVMNSSIHGTGKSLFWEGVVREMYGEYGHTFAQQDLESPYTGSRSGAMFGLFEEIFSNRQKYDNSGSLKHMITGRTQRIERKFMDSYEEANYMNCVFLSNYIQPFMIERNDRRYFVLWPETTLSRQMQMAVDEEIGNGGIQAFYSFLMSLPLLLQHNLDQPVRFDPHTKPPTNAAKARVIGWGLSGWELFFEQWKAGEIAGVPFVSCFCDDVWRLYRWWCGVNNEKESKKNQFMIGIGTRVPKARRWWRNISSNNPDGSQAMIFKVGLPPDNVSEMDYLGNTVLKFQQAVNDAIRV